MKCTHGWMSLGCDCGFADLGSGRYSRRSGARSGLAVSTAAAVIVGGRSPAHGVAVTLPTQNHWLIKNATIYTADGNNTIIEGGDVAVRNGVIVGIGKCGTLAAERPANDETAQQVIDARGHILLPGFVSNHIHETSALRLTQYWSQNIDDRQTSKDIFSDGGAIVTMTNQYQSIYGLSKALTPEESYAITMHSFIGHLKNGTTTVGDVGGLSQWDSMAQAALAIGLRCGPSIWGMDAKLNAALGTVEPGAVSTDVLLADVAAMLAKWARHDSGRIRARPSLLIPVSSSDEAIRQLGALAAHYDVPFVMHAAALRNEQPVSEQFFGKRSIPRLAYHGVLNDRLTIVHSAYISDAERQQLLSANVNVDHSPAKYGYQGEPTVSETKQLTRFLNEGGNLALSSDGDRFPYGHMIAAMQATAIMHNEAGADNTLVVPSKVLEMATRNPAKAMGWDSEIGSIEVGKKADLVLVKADDWRYAAVRRPLTAFLFNGGTADIKHVFVDGIQLVRDGELTMVDEAQLRHSYYLAMQSFSKRVLNEDLPLPH